MLKGRSQIFQLWIHKSDRWKKEAAVNTEAFFIEQKCIFSLPMMLPPSFMCIRLDKGIQYLHSASECLGRVVLVTLVRVPSLVAQCHASVTLQWLLERSSSPFVFYHICLLFFSEFVILLVTFVKSHFVSLLFLLSLLTYLSSPPSASWASSTLPNADQHAISEAQRHA